MIQHMRVKADEARHNNAFLTESLGHAKLEEVEEKNDDCKHWALKAKYINKVKQLKPTTG